MAALLVASGTHSRSGASRPNLFVSASGSNANSCTESAPCKTFGRAYQVAKPGDTVLVLSGSYSAQSIPYDASKTSTACDAFARPAVLSGCVTFQPAPGATVSWASGAGIAISGNGVRILGFSFGPGGPSTGGIDVSSCRSPQPIGYIVVDGIRAGQAGAHVGGPSHHVAILNSSWNFQNTNTGAVGFQINGCGGTALDQPHHLRIDHSTFQNVIETQGHHNTCMHATNAGTSSQGNLHDFVLSNSTFLNCAESDIEIQTASGRYYNVTLENNVFAAPCSGQSGVNANGTTCLTRSSVILGCNVKPYPNHENVAVRFNDMGTAVDWDVYYCGTIGNASRAVGSGETGNIFARGSGCNSLGLTYLYNIVGSGSACGTGGAVAANQWVNPAAPAYDFHLASRSMKAANFVPLNVAGGYPAADHEDSLRPIRGRPDAGAYQWETALIALGRSIGAMRIGQSTRDTLALYGKPRSRRSFKLGKMKLQQLTFRIHAGALWAIVDQDVVIGAGTNAPYYTTARGIGVGSTADSVRSWSGISWVDCRKALRRYVGGVGVYVGLAGGRKGTRIASLTMIKNAYGYGRCKPGS